MIIARFLALLVLLLLLGASGFGFHQAFAASKWTDAPAGFFIGVGVLLHVVAGCLLTAAFFEKVGDK
jgi:hypothetical protein